MRTSLFVAPLVLALSARAAAAQSPLSGPTVPRTINTMPAVAPAPVWAIDRSIVGRMNQARIGVALTAWGRSTAALTDADRAAVQKAFDDLLPGEQFARYRLNEQQSRAMVFLAFGAPPAAPRSDDRADDRRARRDDRNDDRYDDRGDQRRGDSRSSGWRLTRDDYERASDQAEWIRTSAPTLMQGGVHRTHDAELLLLQGVADRARSLDLTVNRASCAAGRPLSAQLVSAAREAIELHQESMVRAWQSIGDARLARIARLADSVQSTLVRCAGDER